MLRLLIALGFSIVDADSGEILNQYANNLTYAKVVSISILRYRALVTW